MNWCFAKEVNYTIKTILKRQRFLTLPSCLPLPPPLGLKPFRAKTLLDENTWAEKKDIYINYY